MPGVLNRALRGYRRLLERGTKFKPPVAVRQATNRWLQQANPLPAFVEAHCVKQPEGRCLVAAFYKAYTTWTQEMG